MQRWSALRFITRWHSSAVPFSSIPRSFLQRTSMLFL
uniref:Uncharacterized protein n=1 Tax=Anguilla anguilla TaxID=7936 RepID=A0A0E9W2G5_ANGAN